MVQKIPFTSIKASGKISSTGNANIDIEPHGTGDVLIGNFHFDADQSISNSNDNHVLTYDHGGGKISLEAAAGGGEDPPGRALAPRRRGQRQRVFSSVRPRLGRREQH